VRYGSRPWCEEEVWSCQLRRADEEALQACVPRRQAPDPSPEARARAKYGQSVGVARVLLATVGEDGAHRLLETSEGRRMREHNVLVDPERARTQAAADALDTCDV